MNEVGPYGLSSYGPSGYDSPLPYTGRVAAGPGSAAASSAPTPEASPAPTESGTATLSPGSDYSTTNNQEVGVDEPDLTKTDGRLLVVLQHSAPQAPGLEVLSVGGALPRLEGSISLSQYRLSDQLFLSGSYAVVIGTPTAVRAGSSPVLPAASSVVTVISLADPAHPVVARSFELQGEEVGARLIEGRVVVVLRDQPRLPFVSPTDGSQAAQAAAVEQNRAVVAGSAAAQWLPSITALPSGRTTTAACATAWHSTVASGLGTVSVVSLDPASDHPGSEATVMGNASTVYASTTGLFIAASPWNQQGMGAARPLFVPVETDVHGFDLSSPSSPRYLGSGAVAGTLIGQYAMSELDGYLRVATTVGETIPPPNEGTPPTQVSDNRVTVLHPSGGALVAVGSIGGLGEGEKIYGVRFVGPEGFVVTFRQTDPLYVLDLSDPTHPALRGQLDLTGYSSFLQPLGGSLLLGVGEAVDSNLRRTGLQLSVFDVSNPAAPGLRSKLVLNGAISSAENDPHALLWWPAQRLVAMPVSDYGGGYRSDGSSGFNGVIVWHLGTDGMLSEIARLELPGPPGEPQPSGGCAECMAPSMAMSYYGSAVERALVIGDLLYTAADSGVMATHIGSWSRAAWLPFNGS